MYTLQAFTGTKFRKLSTNRYMTHMLHQNRINKLTVLNNKNKNGLWADYI